MTRMKGEGSRDYVAQSDRAKITAGIHPSGSVVLLAAFNMLCEYYELSLPDLVWMASPQMKNELPSWLNSIPSQEEPDLIEV
uniref:Uncharacterized protein n=1 Tax=Sphaerodactylus townsendi TaxID=933632 RepID=A0ACB8FIM7_9SAUR